MVKSAALGGLLSPGPSLETEEEDDEFVASEVEGSEADSDDDSDSSSEGAGSEEDGDDSSPGPAPEVAEEMRQALRAIQAQFHEEDDVVFDEEILSDSDISKQFPEEDDLDVLMELESDAGDEGGDNGEGVEDKEQGGEEQQQQQEQEQQEAAAATAAGAGQLPTDSRAGGAAEAAPPALAEQQPQQQQPSGLAEQLATAGLDEGPQLAGFGAPEEWGGGSGGLLAFGAVLGRLEEEDPIARRTRAHHCLNDITLDELEQMLQVDEEFEDLPGADDAEYQRFLQSLREFPDLPTVTGEDSEDEDFAVELAKLLDKDDSEEEGSGGKENQHRKRKRAQASKPRPSRARWVRGPAGEQQQQEAAQALKERRLRPLAPKVPSALPLGCAAPSFGPLAAALSELAITATHDANAPGLPASVRAAVGGMSAAAAAAPQPVGRPRVVWRRPATAAIGAAGSSAAAVRATDGGSGPGLGSQQQQQQQREAEVESPVEGQLQPAVLYAEPSSFLPAQYRQLHRLMHQHVQLLMQVYAMASASAGAENAKVAQQAASMLGQLQRFVDRQTRSRQEAGIPPYDMAALGLQPPGLPGQQPPSRAAAQAAAGGAAWAPFQPPTSIHTVADVALLRKAPALLEALPPPPMPAEAAHSNKAGPSASQPTEPTQAQQQQQPGGASSQPQARVTVAAARAALIQSIQGEEAGGEAEQQQQQQQQQQQGQQQGGASSPPQATATAPAATAVLVQSVPGEEAGGEGEQQQQQQQQPKKRVRVRKKPPKEHPLWSVLSDGARQAVGEVEGLFDPAVIPQPLKSVPNPQQQFTPAEDELLAIGILRYGYNWGAIRRAVLPCKTKDQLFNRKKNLTSARGPKDNPVKRAVDTITGPLCQDEIELLEQALAFYGRQAGRWDIICRDHLPHRQPQVLAQLWSAHTSGSSCVKRTARHKQLQAAAGGGLRSVFLSDPAEQPQPPPQQQQQQQLTGLPAGAALAQVPAEALASLAPRPAGHLHMLLHWLFPPGVDPPQKLQLAAAVEAVATATGAALPGPMAVMLPPGVEPPVGMIPVGTAEGASLPDWAFAAFAPPPPGPAPVAAEQAAAPAAGQQPLPAEEAQQNRDPEPEAPPTAAAAAGTVAAAADAHALTINSPTRDVASELQRLLAGEDIDPTPLLPGGGNKRRRRRRNGGSGQGRERWQSLFAEGEEEGRELQQAGREQHGGGGWSQDSWGLGSGGNGGGAGWDDPYQPLPLQGLPGAPPAAPAAALAGALRPAGAGPSLRALAAGVGGKGPRKRVHFEEAQFDQEHLADSDEELGGGTLSPGTQQQQQQPAGLGHAGPQAPQQQESQGASARHAQQAPQHAEQAFDVEELADSDHEGEQQPCHPALPLPTAASLEQPGQQVTEAAAAVEALLAQPGGKGQGQRRPAAARKGMAGAAALAAATAAPAQAGAPAALQPAVEQPAAAPAVRVTRSRASQQQQQQQQQQWGPSGSRGQAQSVERARRAAIIDASAGPRAAQPAQQAQQLVFDREFDREDLADSDEEAGGAGSAMPPPALPAPSAAAPLMPPAAAAAAAAPGLLEPEVQELSERTTSLVPAAAAATTAVSGPPDSLPTEPEPTSQLAPTRKSRRAAAQQATRQITAWVSGGSRDSGAAALDQSGSQAAGNGGKVGKAAQDGKGKAAAADLAPTKASRAKGGTGRRRNPAAAAAGGAVAKPFDEQQAPSERPSPAAPAEAEQQVEQRQEQGQEQLSQAQLGAAAAAGAPMEWTKDEDRLLVKAMLAAGGELDSQQLAELAAQVGGEAAGRTVAVVEARCTLVMDRLLALQAQREQQQQQ